VTGQGAGQEAVPDEGRGHDKGHGHRAEKHGADAPPSGLVIAIDGPAGAGKSTLAGRLATALRLPYLNTGSMYRALTRRALDQGIDPGDGAALADLASRMRFDLDSSLMPPELRIDDQPPGIELVALDVERTVSSVSRHPEVRRIMVEEQRRLGAPGAVVEGRDIGTVVFDDASVKIFLDASRSERAGRRTVERGGQARAEVAAGMARRDALDSRLNPFVPAPDAVHIDTTDREPDEVFREALALVRRRLRGGR
jgi:cytidylate kinase